MTDRHKPNPEPVETPELYVVSQTDATITFYEKEHPEALIRSDYTVEVRQ